jgi:hypothetical protein
MYAGVARRTERVACRSAPLADLGLPREPCVGLEVFVGLPRPVVIAAPWRPTGPGRRSAGRE